MRRGPGRVALAASAGVLALGLAACGTSDDENGSGSDDVGDGAGGGDGGDLTIYVAASLADVLTAAAEDWTETSGVEVSVVGGGSNALVDQLVEGAPGDMLVTANLETMDRAVEEGVAADPTDLATNTLVAAIAPDNPGGIESGADAWASGRLVVCAPEVPCGTATEELAELSGVEYDPVSLEPNVTDTVGKVETGEADVGIVYQTDVGDLEFVELDQSQEVIVTSAVALTADAGDDAGSLLEHFLSEDVRATLDEEGFGRP
ncbi:molybdate ABC transporter substrate-binding protein [Georgenia sp. Z1491]|uniref:molybdate ABC transporter substrate-binding protein n=1 Tax=Georgenia sp. Z1491 TaxID=3416707 RepID=UPI003CF23E4F